MSDWLPAVVLGSSWVVKSAGLLYAYRKDKTRQISLKSLSAAVIADGVFYGIVIVAVSPASDHFSWHAFGVAFVLALIGRSFVYRKTLGKLPAAIPNLKKSVQFLNVLRFVYIAFGIFVGWLAERLAEPPSGTPFLYIPVLLVGGVELIAILYIRRHLIEPEARRLQLMPENAEAHNRWRTGYVLTFALCMSLALFGFVLRFMGASFSQALPLYAAGLLALLASSPQVRQNETLALP